MDLKTPRFYTYTAILQKKKMAMAEMMEILLVMHEDMKAGLDENTKTSQEILAIMEAMHEDMKADREQRKA
jgi:hypothetical protein